MAASLRLGSIQPYLSLPAAPTDPLQGFPSRNVPIAERFFAGGDATQRAYGRDELGIRGQTLVPNSSGTGFVPSSVVQWNGAARTTTFVSAGSLTATIPAGDLAAAGTALVPVVSPTPGGGAGGTQTAIGAIDWQAVGADAQASLPGA